MHNETPGHVFPRDPIGGSDSRGNEASDHPSRARTLGDWEVLEVKSGGMGEIYICAPWGKDSFLRVALKSFASELFSEPAFRRAFTREAVLSLRLCGVPGVWPVNSIHLVEGRPFLAMPAVPETPDRIVNLRDYLLRRPMDAVKILFFGWSIARTMATAGKAVPGLVHGDLKPENILLWEKIPYVSDFGLGQTYDSLMPQDRLPTTETYAAPELSGELVTRTVASDIYAFGVMLQELLEAVESSGDSREDSFDDVADALAQVSARCVESIPESRPSDFEEIAGMLEAHIPEDWGPMAQRARQRDVLINLAPFTNVLDREGIINALLALNQQDVVLEMIDQVPVQSRDAQLWHWRGLAQAWTDHDDAAVESYQMALDLLGEKAVTETWAVSLDLTSSLTQLGKHADTERILIDLIAAAPDNRHCYKAIHNLAVLYVEMGRPDIAKRLIQRILGQEDNRDLRAKSYVVMAAAERRDREPDRAAQWLRRAIEADAYDPVNYQRLGEVLLYDLARYGEAGAIFDAALEGGRITWELLAWRLACAVLLRDEPPADAMLRLASEAFGSDSLPGLWREALLTAAKVARTHGEPEPEIEDALSAEDLIQVESALEMPQRATMTVKASSVFSFDSDTLHGTGALDPDESVGDMHVSITASGFLVYEFYLDFSVPEYAELFHSWYRVVSTVTTAVVNATVRDIPCIFARCMTCSVEIATNRMAGETFECARCGETAPLDPVSDPSLEPLASSITAILGRQDVHLLDGWESLLLIQPQSELESDIEEAIDSCIRYYGLGRVDSGLPGVLAAFQRGILSGYFHQALPVMAAVYRFPSGMEGCPAMTPQVVERVIESARAIAFPVRVNSSSCQYCRDGEDVQSLFYAGRLEDIEQSLLSRPAQPDDAGLWTQLAGMALLRGDTADAHEKIAHALTADPQASTAWHTLAAIRLEGGDGRGALDAASRALRFGAPRSVMYIILSACHERLGNARLAWKMAQRARGLIDIPAPAAMEHGGKGDVPIAKDEFTTAGTAGELEDEVPPAVFTPREWAQLALLHLFRRTVSVQALLYMADAGNPDAVPELAGLKGEECQELMERAAELDLLETINTGYYRINPSFRRYLEQCFSFIYGERDDTAAQRAMSSYVNAIADFGSYMHRACNSGNSDVLHTIAAEEDNLLHARALAVGAEKWGEAIGCMQGLLELYVYKHRARWTRLVDELIPYLVDLRTDGPFRGREQPWAILTEYRVNLAVLERDWPTAERMQRALLAWRRQKAATALVVSVEELDGITSESMEELDTVQRAHVSNFAAALTGLGEVLMEQGKGECVGYYELAISLYRWLGDPRSEGVVCHHLGHFYARAGPLCDLATAEHWYRRRLSLSSDNDRIAKAQATAELGRIAILRFLEGRDSGTSDDDLMGFLRQAGDAYHQALRVVPEEAVGERATFYVGLGTVWQWLGNAEEALRHFRIAAKMYDDIGEPREAGVTRRRIAALLTREGRLDEALTYASMVLRNVESLKTVSAEDVSSAERLIAEIRRAIEARS